MILGPQGPGKVGQRGGFFFAGVAQLVEHYLAKVDVASSNLVFRSIKKGASGRVGLGAALQKLLRGFKSLLALWIYLGSLA